jgi:hypothetical protein
MTTNLAADYVWIDARSDTGKAGTRNEDACIVCSDLKRR